MSESERETCPKCGEAVRGDNGAYVRYECSTLLDVATEELIQSDACLIRELRSRVAALEGELAKREAAVKAWADLLAFVEGRVRNYQIGSAQVEASIIRNKIVALSTFPSEASETIASKLAQRDRLIEFARRHEQWEANLVMSNEAWQNEAEFPTLTQELYDEAMELQALRNAALAGVPRATERKAGE